MPEYSSAAMITEQPTALSRNPVYHFQQRRRQLYERPFLTWHLDCSISTCLSQPVMAADRRPTLLANRQPGRCSRSPRRTGAEGGLLTHPYNHPWKGWLCPIPSGSAPKKRFCEFEPKPRRRGQQRRLAKPTHSSSGRERSGNLPIQTQYGGPPPATLQPRRSASTIASLSSPSRFARRGSGA